MKKSFIMGAMLLAAAATYAADQIIDLSTPAGVLSLPCPRQSLLHK